MLPDQSYLKMRLLDVLHLLADALQGVLSFDHAACDFDRGGLATCGVEFTVNFLAEEVHLTSGGFVGLDEFAKLLEVAA